MKLKFLFFLKPQIVQSYNCCCHPTLLHCNFLPNMDDSASCMTWLPYNGGAQRADMTTPRH